MTFCRYLLAIAGVGSFQRKSTEVVLQACLSYQNFDGTVDCGAEVGSSVKERWCAIASMYSKPTPKTTPVALGKHIMTKQPAEKSE